MKTLLTSILFLIIATTTLSQEEATSRLMVADSSWGIEKFKVPTGFAQEMTYHGFEEAFFPKGWGTVDSPEFWSYIFTWSVAADAPITTTDFENNLALYFDGLLNISQKDTTVTKLPSTVLLVNTDNGKTSSNFVGKLRIFDRFRTNKMITLNVLVEQQYCEKEKRSISVFRFSPKALEHEVWTKLKSVTLREEVCQIN
ncbi:hypothetical protein G5B37_02245 [Rasiella rasia]|uniref:Uncharacterized protein n=1 Tax=Rasiella rasia TaxID=2744027 RepID=A0A6G6GIT2_9FLAO|nr:hypothetical protein [Rasiella rasia]QIE58424.1 hypothetical protein G5B37_02245 [Rasiella rasia]